LKNEANAATALQAAREDGYDYVTITLPHSLEARHDVTALESRWWRSSVVGMIPESNTLSIHLPRQMEWAHHMNIPAVILPTISQERKKAIEYARLISSMAYVASGINSQLWIKTDLTEESLLAFELLHRQCDGPNNIGMVISFDNHHIQAPNPNIAVATNALLLHKAIGNNLKAIIIPTHIFLTNKRGYPALSKTHQILLTDLLRRVGRTLRVLIEGPTQHPLPSDAGGATKCLPYLQYIRHMRQRPEITQAIDARECKMEEPYLDHLQRPLQPLGDHLEFGTYETFEKDPVKYVQYTNAIALALRDNLIGVENKLVILVVAGAGRGPLVSSALEAIATLPISSSQISFRIFAVEKNPSAVVYLQSLASYDEAWNDIVTVVHSDMRNLSCSQLGNQMADIVISELLGSFGDNELAPECLDSLYATGICKESTICIPSRFSSFLAPVSSLRLHSEVRSQAYYPNSACDGLDSAPMGTLKVLETPYVVRSHAASQTHPEQRCWEFTHPSMSRNTNDNINIRERVSHIEFPPDATYGAGYSAGYGPLDQTIMSLVHSSARTQSGSMFIHGFLGTFSATLYSSTREDTTITLSTRPTDFSVGMFSWFPLFFPLKEPLYVPANATLSVSIWRKTDESKVWYEWTAEVSENGSCFGCTHIHNPNGRSYFVRL
jgi:type II protein arginine methyltransferase